MVSQDKLSSDVIYYVNILNEDIDFLIKELQSCKKSISNVKSGVNRGDLKDGVYSYYTLLATYQDLENIIQSSIVNNIMNFKPIDAQFEKVYT